MGVVIWVPTAWGYTDPQGPCPSPSHHSFCSVEVAKKKKKKKQVFKRKQVIFVVWKCRPYKAVFQVHLCSILLIHVPILTVVSVPNPTKQPRHMQITDVCLVL